MKINVILSDGVTGNFMQFCCESIHSSQISSGYCQETELTNEGTDMIDFTYPSSQNKTLKNYKKGQIIPA